MENILLNTPVAYFIFPLQNSEQAELSVGHGHLHHESEEQAGWIEKIALRCYSKSQRLCTSIWTFQTHVPTQLFQWH